MNRIRFDHEGGAETDRRRAREWTRCVCCQTLHALDECIVFKVGLEERSCGRTRGVF